MSSDSNENVADYLRDGVADTLAAVESTRGWDDEDDVDRTFCAALLAMTGAEPDEISGTDRARELMRALALVERGGTEKGLARGRAEAAQWWHAEDLEVCMGIDPSDIDPERVDAIVARWNSLFCGTLDLSSGETRDSTLAQSLSEQGYDLDELRAMREARREVAPPAIEAQTDWQKDDPDGIGE